MQPQDGGWRAVIGEDWSQGRATFGGMVAALGNEAMRRLVPLDRELRGLETTFVGPALAGEVRMDAEVLRVGKAVSIASARLWSDGKVAAALTGIYGAARVTALDMTPTPAAGVRPAADLAGSRRRRHGRPIVRAAFRLSLGRRRAALRRLESAHLENLRASPGPGALERIPRGGADRLHPVGGPAAHAQPACLRVRSPGRCNFFVTTSVLRPKRGGASTRRSIPPAADTPANPAS